MFGSPLQWRHSFYAGSVEFIAAAALVMPFSPLSVALVTLMVSGRQIFYGISMLEKYGAQLGKNCACRDRKKHVLFPEM